MIKAQVLIGSDANGKLTAIAASSDVQAVKDQFKKLREEGGGGYTELVIGRLEVELRSKHEPEPVKPVAKTKPVTTRPEPRV
jgi:hypothetical protein